MKLSLLVACICGHLWLTKAAVIPSSVTAVLTNEKKPVAAQLFREHVKSIKSYGSNISSDKNGDAKVNFKIQQHGVEENVFSWYTGRYSYDYVPGETIGLLLSQRALRKDIIELLALNSSFVDLPYDKLVVPSQTETIWKYKKGKTQKTTNMYALYLPVNYLQQLMVSPLNLEKFVVACGHDLAYALSTSGTMGFGENRRPLLLGWANPDDLITGDLIPTSGKLKVKRENLLTFGGTNLGDTLSFTDREVVRGDEIPAIRNPPFANNTLWDQEEKSINNSNNNNNNNNDTNSRSLFGKKYSQVVVAPFSFEERK